VINTAYAFFQQPRIISIIQINYRQKPLMDATVSLTFRRQRHSRYYRPLVCRPLSIQKAWIFPVASRTGGCNVQKTNADLESPQTKDTIRPKLLVYPPHSRTFHKANMTAIPDKQIRLDTCSWANIHH